MKNILIFVFSILIFNQAFAQKGEAEKYFNLAEEKFALKEYDAAILQYTKAIEVDSKYKLAYNNRGASKSWLGKKEEAILDYKKAIEIDPDFSRAYQNMGDDYSNLKKYTDSYNAYSKAIDLGVNDGNVYNYRGNCLYSLEKYKEAIEDYTKAIKLVPKYFWAYYNRGKARHNLNLYVEAISDFSRAIEIDPSNVDIYNDRGNSKFALKDFTGAIPDYDRYLALNPKSSQVHANKGFAKFYIKQYKSALSDLNRAVEEDPKNATAWCWRSDIKIALKENKSALIDINKALELSPDYPWAFMNRARVRQEIGDKYEALTDFNRALDISQFAEGYFYRAIFYDKIFKEYPKACENFQSAIKLDPTNSEMINELTDFQKKHKGINCSIETIVRNNNRSNTTNQSQSNDVEFVVAKEKKSKVWAVIVGISDYKEPGINDLKYAKQDAEIYYNFLKSAQGGGIADERVRLLTDKNATRINIIKALDDLFNQAEPQDMVIFYTACHGQADPRTRKVYFICHDTEVDALNATAVSQREVEEIFESTKAGKRIWLADACHSGGAGLQIRANEAALTQKLLDEIGNSGDGIAILSSSSNNEFSYEDIKWGNGHGVFTYYLTEGLKGKADEDKDGKVSIREIEEYVKSNVKRDTKGQQHPELKGRYDNNMPISVIK